MPNGRVVLSPGGVVSGDCARVRDVSLVVVTAWNPGTERPGAAANREANEKLRQVLQAGGWTFFDAEGFNPDRSHVEPSFVVLGPPDPALLKVARQFGQAAVFAWDGNTGEVVYLA